MIVIAAGLTVAGALLLAAALIFFMHGLVTQRPAHEAAPGFALLAAANGVLGAGAALTGDWPSVAVYGIVVIVTVVIWWLLRRKRRDRAPRAYGAKSRALLAALVRKAREAARPRPVLRPVPQGGFR